MRKLQALAVLVTAMVLIGIAGTTAKLWHDGWRAYVVHTGSMSPTYDPGDLVLDRPAHEGYEVGDVVTFRPSRYQLVTHRVTRMTRVGVHTKGDANGSADAWTIPSRHVVGVVHGHLVDMGFVVVFMKQPTAVLGVMTSGLALVLLWGIFFPAGPTPAPVTTREAEAARPARKPRRHLLQGA